jgi:chromosome segregation ATPase
MSNSENGKNGKAKNGEIDRLLKLIDAVARIDTKVSALNDQLRQEIEELKERQKSYEERLAYIESSGAKPMQKQFEDLSKRVDDACNRVVSLEERRSDLVQQVEKNEMAITKTDEGITRWKIYWGAVTFIVVPLFTYIVVKLLNIAFHIPV